MAAPTLDDIKAVLVKRGLSPLQIDAWLMATHFRNNGGDLADWIAIGRGVFRDIAGDITMASDKQH